jgi:hypothetical protein
MVQELGFVGVYVDVDLDLIDSVLVATRTPAREADQTPLLVIKMTQGLGFEAARGVLVVPLRTVESFRLREGQYSWMLAGDMSQTPALDLE